MATVTLPESLPPPESFSVPALDINTALNNVALRMKASGTIKSEKFTITPAMRQAVYRQLKVRGRPVSPALLAALGPVIDQQLRHEIVSVVFGAAAAVRYDRQVSIAAGLLRKASTPHDLLRLGTSDKGYTTLTLEAELHRAFAKRRVNRVNERKESLPSR